jgi:formimidoylglutamate deiminase
VRSLVAAGAAVCACPTTERNLGDGIVPAALYLSLNVPICLGTDSNVQIDPLEDARELEYHLRLQNQQRVVLARPGSDKLAALGIMLFDCATRHGANSIGWSSGTLDPGNFADCFSVDLEDPSIAGASDEDLLPTLVFSSSRSAVRDVFVGGKQVITDGRHRDQDEIIKRFRELQGKLWA